MDSYLITFHGILNGQKVVALMLRKVPADHTDRGLILAAEEFQGLLVLLTKIPASSPTGLGPFLQLEEPGLLRQVGQDPVASGILQVKGVSALRAGPLQLPFGDTAFQARQAVVVAAAEHARVLEDGEADGAQQVFCHARHLSDCGHPGAGLVLLGYLVPEV